MTAALRANAPPGHGSAPRVRTRSAMRRLLHLLTLLVLSGGCATHGTTVGTDRSAGAGAPASARELVVLVHGMGRTPISMLPLELSFERAGYRVLNYGYSSYGPGIAEIGADLDRALDALRRDEPISRVHFVGHSLGNIVIRWLLANERPRDTGRVVMLAPPNQGAHAADRAAPYLGWLLKSLRELTTDGGTALNLGAPEGVEFAIIAGARDGKVSVRETYLPGATDHAVVPAGHTFLMLRPSVIGMAHRFLQTGALLESARDTESDSVSVVGTARSPAGGLAPQIPVPGHLTGGLRPVAH